MSGNRANNDIYMRIPTFQEEKFRVFGMKFKAMAAIEGFAVALEPGFKRKLPT